jgi:hypothetical protein
MPVLTVDDLTSGEGFAGFSGVAEILIHANDHEEWQLDAVMVQMRRDGEFVWEHAPPVLAKAIKDEILASDHWQREIQIEIGVSEAAERYDRSRW